MAPDTSDRKATKPSQAVGVPPPEAEHLPCPRCDSTNTKFCYYNNYNFSQPRHFCKSCRRYWTHGGTLRDIPFGGGSRKNAKRSRTIATAPTAAAAAAHNDYRHFPVPLSGDHHGGGMMCGSFTSLLSNSHGSNGLLGLGGFGLGIDNGLEDVGFGMGRAVWPFSGVVEGGPTSGGGGSGVVGHTWQVENGEGGFVGSGDCFAWPDLAISTPGSVLK